MHLVPKGSSGVPEGPLGGSSVLVGSLGVPRDLREYQRICETMREEQKHTAYNRNINFAKMSTASAVLKTLSVPSLGQV